MSETPNSAAPNGPAQGQPSMRVVNQYLKDLSFESPAAPGALRPDLPQPAVDVSVDVNARALGENQYEVELSCSATATREGETVFVAEANYAGLFLIENLQPEQLEAVLLVEAPRLLFPFARQIIATATRDGGFMPLMLEPLDFATMYRVQKARQQSEQGQPEGTA